MPDLTRYAHVMVSPHLWDLINQACHKTGYSRGELIRVYLVDYLEFQKGEKEGDIGTGLLLNKV